MAQSGDAIEVRWYNTNKEQFHSKIAHIKGLEKSYVTAGSANFTSRNLDDYNLENNMNISAPSKSEFIKEIDAYFKRLWNNEDAEEDALAPVKYGVYWIQKSFRFTTY